jgi:hypothetical protein
MRVLQRATFSIAIAISLLAYFSPAVAGHRAAQIQPEKIYHWVSEDDNRKSYTAQGVNITIEQRTNKEGTYAVLVARDPIGRVARIETDSGIGDTYSADFAIGRIDAAGLGGDVFFAPFSGGANCCLRYWVLAKNSYGWRVVDVGPIDIEFLPSERAEFPRNPLKDRRSPPVFVLGDQNFDMAFGGHIGSILPPWVLEVRNGTLVDVTTWPRYRSLIEADIPRVKAFCVQHSNPGCAALVAEGARLGRLRETWNTMLRYYDRNDLEDVITGCDKRRCHYAYGPFPDQLANFLVYEKYLTRSQVPKH